MTNLDKYKQAFINGLEISESEVNSQLEYQWVKNWDSVGHMTLIAELEDAFDIIFEAADIINFSSYDKGIEILKKYNIEFW